MPIERPKQRSRTRRRIFLYGATLVASCLMLTFFILGQANASHVSPSVIEQHWELLNYPCSSCNGYVYIDRGVLPGGTSKFDPQPTVTFEAVGKTTGGAGSGLWRIKLRSLNYSTWVWTTLAEVTFGASDTAFTIKTASFSWPSTDKDLTVIEVSPEGSGLNIPGDLDFHKAYLKIKQSGTIKKTVGQIPLTTDQGVSNTSWNDTPDPVFYYHATHRFNPAPTVRLRIAGSSYDPAVVVKARLVDSGGTPVAGSEVVVGWDPPYHSTSAPLTLSAYETYHTQVSASGSAGGAVEDVDLVLEQSTTDTHGLRKTTGWFPAVSFPQTFSTDEGNLEFLFNSPSGTARSKDPFWYADIKRTGGTGSVAMRLQDRTANASRAYAGITTSSSYDHFFGTATESTTGNDLDSRADLSTVGTTGRISSSIFGVTYELRDTTQPSMTFSPASPDPFSPNTPPDGVKDTTTFSASITDPSTPITWELWISDLPGTWYRSYSGSGSSVSQAWDGKDFDGVVVSDGTYRGVLTGTDSEGNSKTLTRNVVVDTVPPSVSNFTETERYFSPNVSIGVKDSTTFSAVVSESVSWTLEIVPSAGGSPIRTFTGTGQNVSATWDGKNSGGAWVADGDYVATLKAPDIAGNSQNPTRTVTVDKTAPTFTGYHASPNPFSPWADPYSPGASVGVYDTTTFSPTSISENSPVTWSMEIKNSAGTLVKSFTGSGLESVWQVVWDGKNTGGTVQPEGDYTATTTVTDAAGNATTRSATVKIDNSPPSISGFDASNDPFSPATPWDGTKDTTIFSATLTDPSTPITWTIDIKNSSNQTVKSQGGSGNPSWEWDGKDTTGTVVPDGAYTAYLTATDYQELTSPASTTTATVDNTQPTVSGFDASNDPFNPNTTNTTFTANFTDTSTPITWTLDIKNSSGTLMKNFTGSGITLSQLWDGKDTTGTVVADGTYTATVTATDSVGNDRSEPTTVRVDKTAPTFTNYGVTNNPFNPNTTTTTFGSTATVSDASTVTWTMDIKNSSGALVKSFSGSGTNVSQVWDGKNTTGTVQPDGDYTTTTTVTDAAGNSTARSATVKIDKTAASVSNYYADTNPFSPGASTGVKDTTVFGTTATVSDASSVTWTVTVYNASGTPLKTYTGSGTNLSQSWDGKNTTGTVQPDGTYTATVTVQDAAGNSSTASGQVRIDNTNPSISNYSADTNPFSPNGDAYNNTTTFGSTATVSDASTVTWTVTVYNASGTPLKTYTGSGTNLSQSWDGKNTAGTVQPDGIYTATVTVQDAAGNSGTASGQVRIDNTNPSISNYSADTNPFSPNGDAYNNTTTFGSTATVSDASTVTWTVTVYNASGTPLKTYTGSGTNLSQSWDGKNTAGTVQPDGTYTATVTVQDAAGNSGTASGQVTIDNSVPSISGFDASNDPFSPAPPLDGTKDTTVFSATITDPSPVSWTMNVRNASNATIRTFTGTGNPSQTWDGKDTTGTVQPDGLYTAYLTATDSQSLTSPSSTTTVTVDNTQPTVSGFDASNDPFNPNTTNTTFTANFTDTSTPITWTLDIKNSSGTLMKNFTGSGTTLSQLWDGKDTTGTVVADGTYTATVTATDSVGNDRSEPTTLRIDKTTPSFTNYYGSPTPFSPGVSTGTKDITTFGSTATVTDASSVTWTMDIKNSSSALVKSFSGTTTAVSQDWDGKNTGGTLQPDGDYTATTTVTDAAGNTTTRSATVKIDKTAPVITGFGASNNPFSPNASVGTKDTTTFSATLTDPSTPITWTLDIKNSSNVTVRSYTGSGTSLSQAWDGENGSGVDQPEGTYTAYLTATDSQSLSSSSSTITVVIDDSPPAVSGFGVTNNPFNPNATTTTFGTTATVTDASSVTWTMDIKNSSDTLAKGFTGSGTNLSQVWDGKDATGTVVAEGIYTATATVTDGAGNSTARSATVRVDKTAPTFTDYYASPNPFSPGVSTGTNDTTTFGSTATVSDASSVTWTTTIKNSSGVTMTSTSGSGTNVSHLWDGKNTAGTIQPDGDYTATTTVTDAVGNSTTRAATVKIDKTAPVITGFGANNNPFSPNTPADGNYDTTTFAATVTETSTVTWTLDIKNSSNQTVKTHNGSGNPSWEWDGKNTTGTVVADGTYTATITVTDAQNLSGSPTNSVTVTVDTVAPAISGPYQASPEVFSPNDNGSNEITTFSATFSETSLWTLGIKNSSNQTKRFYTTTSSSFSFEWDGRDSSYPPQIVEDGDYTADLWVMDPAGNVSEAEITVTVDTTGPTATDYLATPNPFSPNGDGFKETTTVTGSLSDPHGLFNGGWTLNIKDELGLTHRTFYGSGATVSKTWDGKDSSPLPIVVPDGEYAAELTVSDTLFNESKITTTVIVDNSAPRVEYIESSPNPFSPNGDQISDVTNFTAVLDEPSEPITWTLQIQNPANITIRSYSGTGTPTQDWDGKDANGLMMPNGPYTVRLAATDSQNQTVTDTVGIVIDTFNSVSPLPCPVANPLEPPPPPPPAPPRKQVFFNDRESSNRAITDRYVQLIRETANNATILIAMNKLSEEHAQTLRIVEELEKAAEPCHDKNLTIKVISQTGEYDAPRLTALAAEVKTCNGCFTGAASTGLMHSKFMLINDMMWDPDRNDEKVVVQSSANWNWQLQNYYNDMIVTWDDREPNPNDEIPLYDLYSAYWNDLRACANGNCPGSDNFPGVGGSSSSTSEKGDAYPDTRMYLYPQADTKDTIEDVINDINCIGGTFNGVPYKPQIWVGMFSFKRGAVVDALVNAKKRGCRVLVIFNETDSQATIDKLKNGNIELKCHDWIHSKYLFFRSKYSGSTQVQENVFAGSHNYTTPAFNAHDDVMLRVISQLNNASAHDDVDSLIWDRYHADFNRIWSKSGACGSGNID